MAIRIFLLAATLAALPSPAAASPRATLVRCGSETCLRLSGERADAATPVRIGGRALAVEGGRRWRIVVPLATARRWPVTRDYAVPITFGDGDSDQARTESAALPPGSLGGRVELASLVIAAH